MFFFKMAFDYSMHKCSGKALREAPNLQKNCNWKNLLEGGWLVSCCLCQWLSLLKVWWIHFENWKWNSRSSLLFKEKKLVKNGKILLKQWSVTTCTPYTLKKVHTSYSPKSTIFCVISFAQKCGLLLYIVGLKGSALTIPY
jgi:hypothetical protein